MKFKIKVPRILKSVKYSLGAVNCSYLITGIILLLCGIIVLVSYKEYDLFITQKFYDVPAFAIAIGTIIIVSSALGFYAAMSQDFYFVIGYVAVSAIVLILEMTLVIIGYGLWNNVSSEIRQTMTNSRQFYGERIEHTAAWDNLQMGFECCGVSGRHDWRNGVPVSCCHIDYGVVSPFECTQTNAYTTGCLSALSEWLSYKAYAMAVTSLVVICFQIVNTAVACWLAYRTKYEDVDLES
ncbi:unnamed protein product [Diatraea saccharalis]|uniref:Tetraspanin n=1 Tax=Diatraea saccharalis TaxID=40085 RepID=A0A9N9QUE7_9NEOP|nr:unnamed protein product [Diatraea saccharalis]